jgi:hypothetical protein
MTVVFFSTASGKELHNILKLIKKIIDIFPLGWYFSPNSHPPHFKNNSFFASLFAD